MDPLIALLLLAALLIGMGLGWWLGGRPVADWRARHGERDAEAKDLAERLSRMAPELATMSDRAARADTLATQLDAARDELTTLRTQAAGFEEQKRLLSESREALLKEFQNTGSKVLGEAQEAFLTRAAERLGHSEKASAEKIKALLDPVDRRLSPTRNRSARWKPSASTPSGNSLV